MKPIKVWNDDTKEFVAGGNQRHGDNLYIERPSYEEPFEEVWYNYEDIPEDEWRKEFELVVKDKVWKEEFRFGAALEYRSFETFMQKDCLERSLSNAEIRFLNAYRSRFMLIQENKKNYIYDIETKTKYDTEHQGDFVSFKDFKAELKNLNLI